MLRFAQHDKWMGVPSQGVVAHFVQVCEVFFWRDATPLFTVAYEPYWKGE
jgi:hypothetical protein